jgi:hypothetical protein
MRQVLLASAALVAIVGAASASPVTIADGFVQAGVSDEGTLGSNSNNSPGILYDKTGMGNYGINDFLTPGDPFEGFYVKSAQGYWGSNNDYSPTDFGTSNAPVSLTGSSASWTGMSNDAMITVSHTYTLTTLSGRSVILMSTTITNNSTAGALTGLEFLRTTDPDPDVNAFGSYYTQNAIVGGDACGTGPSSGQTICIGTDSTLAHMVGVSQAWSEDPDTYLAGVNDGNGDYAIGLAFWLPDLASGQSYTFDYYYALGKDRGTASGDVPEPMSIALVGAGLAGIGAIRRRRKKKSA